MQQAIWLRKAEIGRRNAGRGKGLGAAIGFGIAAFGKVGFSHNWTPDRRDRFAKAERGKRISLWLPHGRFSQQPSQQADLAGVEHFVGGAE